MRGSGPSWRILISICQRGLPLLNWRPKFTITTHSLDTGSTIAWFGAAVRYVSLLELSSRVGSPSAIYVAEQPPPEQPDQLGSAAIDDHFGTVGDDHAPGADEVSDS